MTALQNSDHCSALVVSRTNFRPIQVYERLWPLTCRLPLVAPITWQGPSFVPYTWPLFARKKALGGAGTEALVGEQTEAQGKV